MDIKYTKLLSRMGRKEPNAGLTGKELKPTFYVGKELKSNNVFKSGT